MSKSIKRQIEIALRNVQQEISATSKQGFYAAAMASEGYAGGYQRALYDVTAALNGVPPSGGNRYWPSPNKSLKLTQGGTA